MVYKGLFRLHAHGLVDLLYLRAGDDRQLSSHYSVDDPLRLNIMFSAQAGLKFRITTESLQAHFSGTDKLPRPAVLDCDVFIAGSGPIAYVSLHVHISQVFYNRF